MTTYPEHEKLRAVKDESQAIGEFLDSGGYVLARHDEGTPDVPRWMDERTGNCMTPRGHEVSIVGEHTVENIDWRPADLVPVGKSVQQILADYFEIDLDKIETEKRAMLDALRAA